MSRLLCSTLLLLALTGVSELRSAPAGQPTPNTAPPTATVPAKAPAKEAGSQYDAPKDEPNSGTQEGFTESWLDGLKVFGSLRFRPEFRGNYDFDHKRDDNAEFVGQRIQLGVEKKFGADVNARIVLQDSRVWGGSSGSDNGLSTANANSGESTDLREAWVGVQHLFELPLAVELGRQILSYGDERLVGGLEFTNVGRSFDTLRLKVETKRFDSHLFAAVIAEEDSDSAGNTTGVGSGNASGFRFSCDPTTRACSVLATTPRELDDAYFSGFYNTFRAAEWLTIDAYALGVHKKWITRTTPIANIAGAEITTEDRSRQRDNLYTFGGRVTNRKKKGAKEAKGIFDYSVEYAVQRGTTGEEIAASWDVLKTTVARRDIFGNPLFDSAGKAQTVPLYVEKKRYAAYAYAGDAGVTFGRFRVGGEVAVGSGDSNRSDGVTTTFSNLFPTNHAFYGQADQVGWANMRGTSADVTIKLGKFGRVQVAYWYVRKHRLQDGWYDVTGSLKSGASTESATNARFGHETGAPGTVPSRSVASLRRDLFREFDLTYWLDYKRLNLVVGYSRIQAGDSIADVRNDVLASQDVRKPSFDPRADFFFVMTTFKF